MIQNKEQMIDLLRAELSRRTDEKTMANEQRFFRESIKFYGVKLHEVHKTGLEFFEMIKDASKKEVFEICEQLWQSGYMEESFIACDWAYNFRDKFEKQDIQIFERWIDHYVSNWASCDALCNHTIGAFIEMYPEQIEQLKLFARSDNRWKRRAAAVTLIIPARKGKFLSDIRKIAEILMTDKDDLVQKGNGWMLKAASEAHQQEIFDFVMQNKARMPRTSLRYAIEKMPAELKSMAMAK